MTALLILRQPCLTSRKTCCQVPLSYRILTLVILLRDGIPSPGRFFKLHGRGKAGRSAEEIVE